MKSNLFHLFAWTVLVLGVAIEAQIMEKPTEETVAKFEAAEYPSVQVLDHAIEDAKTVAEYISEGYETAARMEEATRGTPGHERVLSVSRLEGELSFRAFRVLRLLQEIREKEVTA